VLPSEEFVGLVQPKRKLYRHSSLLRYQFMDQYYHGHRHLGISFATLLQAADEAKTQIPPGSPLRCWCFVHIFLPPSLTENADYDLAPSWLGYSAFLGLMDSVPWILLVRSLLFADALRLT